MKVEVKVKLTYPNDMLQQRVNRTNSCAYLFYNYGGDNLDFIERLDTSKAISAHSMFSTSWKLISAPFFDTSNIVYGERMFDNCIKLKTIPLYDTSKLEDADYMFNTCYVLETIPALNFSNVKSMTRTFGNCRSLKTMLMYGMKVSFDISASTLFEASDLEVILNNLATVTETQTLTMGATNLAKLTETQKAIATSKGWVLA